MKGDSINSLLQMQAYRRAEMEGQVAKRDVYGETKTFVENWRKNNGLEGTKAIPNRNEVPFQWMVPFLGKVETEDTASDPLIANTPQDGPYPDTPRYKNYNEAGGNDELFIRDQFIEDRGKDIFKLFTGIDLAKKKKGKKNNELTIYDEAARRDAFRDMGTEPYDPDTGRLGGGFDIMDDLLDGV